MITSTIILLVFVYLSMLVIIMYLFILIQILNCFYLTVSSALKNYIKNISLFSVLTAIIVRVLFNGLLIHGSLVSNPNACSLSIDQCLLILIWIGGYFIYKMEKNKTELVKALKNKTKGFIISTCLIHILFVKVLIICIMCVLYLILNENTFLSVIPFFWLSILSPLFGFPSHWDSQVLVCHMADDKEVAKRLPEIWQANANLMASIQNSGQAYLNFLKYKGDLNELTLDSQGTGPAADIRPPEEYSKYRSWLDGLRYACEYLFSPAANDLSVSTEKVNIFTAFPVSNGRVPFIPNL